MRGGARQLLITPRPLLTALKATWDGYRLLRKGAQVVKSPS